MGTNSNVAGLTACQSGWTGSVQLVVLGIVAGVTPVDGDSVASVWTRLVDAATRTYGTEFLGHADADGKLRLKTRTLAFAIAATSNTATRLGVGSASGQLNFVSSGTHGGVYPSQGIAASVGSGPSRAQGFAVSGGSYARVGKAGYGSGSLSMHGSYAEIVGMETNLAAATGRYDLWSNGYVIGRYSISDIQRTSTGGLGSLAQLNLTLTGSS